MEGDLEAKRAELKLGYTDHNQNFVNGSSVALRNKMRTSTEEVSASEWLV